MNGRKMRSLFLKARGLAMQMAKNADFCTVEKIKRASASCCNSGGAFVSVEFNGQVEKAQILSAFLYGATLLGLSVSYSSEEDMSLSDPKCSLLTISLGAGDKCAEESKEVA